MKSLKIFSLLVSSLFTTCCVLPQHRLDFDLTRNALVSCDERLRIKRIATEEKGDGNFYRIASEKDSNGSSMVYFDRENKGYYYNTEYQSSSNQIWNT